MEKIRKLLSLNWLQFIYYNFLCKNIIRDRGKFILPRWGARIELNRSAKIILHAHLSLNENRYPRSRAECYLRLRSGAKMTVNGRVNLVYHGTIEVHKNAELQIGACLVQSGAVIISAYRMRIGNDCLFGRMSYLSDSDHHTILDGRGGIINYPRETIIGDHVWVGVKASILKGAQIGEGCVIAAHAVAGGHIPEGALVRYPSAKRVSDVYWSAKGFGEIP